VLREVRRTVHDPRGRACRPVVSRATARPTACAPACPARSGP